MIYNFFNQNFFREVICDHYSSSVYFSILDLHFFRKEVGVEAIKKIGVWFVQNFCSFVEKENQLLFDDDFLSLNLCFFKWFGWFDFEGFQEERMELCECEFGAENTSIEEKVDDLTVLKNIGL